MHCAFVSILLAHRKWVDCSLIWLSKQALEAQEDSLNVVCCSPLVLQDIKADSAREIDIWMVDWRFEQNGGWGVWVV